MNVSGMNKTSEDKALAIVNPVASCQSLSYGRICSPVRESGNQTKSLSTAVNCHGLIEEFQLPLSGDAREDLLLRASLKNRVENHRLYQPSVLCGDSVCLTASNEILTDCLDPKLSVRCDSTPGGFKSPVASHGLGSVEYASESTSVTISNPSSNHITNCFTESNHCNGSIITTSGGPGCFTPPSDILFDVNGRSGSQTPASINDSERVKMDLTKLDDTIDYVLSYARSDEPCEGMFVLPCRSRDPALLSSPNLRANTPSSGMLASPSSSPNPSSPPSCRVVSSPMLNQTKTQSLVQSSSVPCVVSQSVPRFIVDQTSGVLHFPRSMNPSGVTQGVTQPTVSFVHVYSDSPNIPEPVSSEQPGSHTKPLNAATQMVLHSNVIHGFQNHVVTPQNAFTVPPSSVPHTFNSIVSPTKVNLVHALPTRVSRVNSLSPTYTSFAHASDSAGLVSNRTVLFSPSNALCVMQSPMLSPVYETTTSNFPTDHQAALTYTSFQSSEKGGCPTSSASFRQPVAPQQPLFALSGQGSAVPVNNQTDNHMLINSQTSVRLVPVKKRGYASSSTGSKRRKTSTATNVGLAAPCPQLKAQSETVQPGRSSIQECLETLKRSDVKSLVSAPVLKPHASVLLPTGGSDPPVCPLSDEDEQELMKRRSLKYSRGPLAVQVPKLPSHKGDTEADTYILQHLRTTAPLGPLVSPRKYQKPTGCVHPICSSPEPPSFENHMRALFSSMHRSPKFEEEKKLTQLSPAKLSFDRANLDPKLIPIFSEVSMGKQDPERCTPPLPLFHMPNPRLICQPICLGTGGRDIENRAMEGALSTSDKHENSKVFSNLAVQTTQRIPEFGDIPSTNGPLIDSETGEIVAGRHPPLSDQTVSNDSGAEKLHITFTINPSMTSGVSTIVRRIAELLGIDQSAVCYQVTRSGAQITLDQKQSQSETVMKNLENQLREQFTPLSLHVEKATNQPEDPSSSPTQDASALASSAALNPIKSGHLEATSNANTKDNFPLVPSESSRYAEEPVSVLSLLTSKRTVIKPCQNCDKPVPPHAGQRKCLDEIAALSGLSSRTSLSDDFVFCSVDCFVQFSRLVSNRHVVDDISFAGKVADEIGSQHSADNRLPTLACDFSASVPILLHCSLPKSSKISKRQAASAGPLVSGCKKRGVTNGLGSFRSKRWRGSRWRPFSSHSLPQYSKLQPSTWCEMDVAELLRDHPSHLSSRDEVDNRVCLLCAVSGDAPEDGLGRLLPYDVDKWLHINCALWCFEVYETVGGSLSNVDMWLKKAKETICSHCGHVGAGLPCYNPRCTSVYHVSCAVELRCMFFTDRGMYCPHHQPKEQHPMQLLSLAVSRRVYIARDENTQVGSVIHEEDRASVVRIGSVYLQSVGQLLPHQIESGYFHARRYIYPVGFRSTRIYWSMRKPKSRARYVCEILESGGRPLFKITVIDKDFEDLVFTHETCSGVWRCVLSKIEQLREQNKLVRLFSQHLKGEDLYGLSEPHIVRAVESLPGVEGLRDYVFHFGRMELIAEMPLAINPSGCARSEPKMQTYVKRCNVRGDRPDASATRSPCFPGLRRSAYPALTPTSAEFSKQHQSSRSQQYRRLKSEVSSNVILGRSRIQGLGLFAARHLEPQTMVIEYIGELIRSELANKREKVYEAHNRGIYMFRLDEDTVIDATVCGGLARYINHSCQPNCYAEFLTLGEQSHIVIITNRHIDKGEELCYDYNFDLEDRGSKIPCLCRAPNCRKWMN
ncbi:Histone-lysine N-methyltransferase MLL3 [Fasciola gigantica]|uniref:Histone-lysine N-methyltransferase MLL3 n=1 Tax=Fasciola gigantica TaxID=46835 RepID=A0A504YIN3_FASGI|nr:Histone-lysine N-methyltransferase MLL3 [Fasciola gigantica]